MGFDLGFWFPIVWSFHDFSAFVIDGFSVCSEFAFVALHDDVEYFFEVDSVFCCFASYVDGHVSEPV